MDGWCGGYNISYWFSLYQLFAECAPGGLEFNTRTNLKYSEVMLINYGFKSIFKGLYSSV